MATEANETQEKRPFYKTVISTVTGEMKGGVVGGITGGIIGAVILGSIGAAGLAIAALAAPAAVASIPLVGALGIGGVGGAALSGLIGGAAAGGAIGGVTSAVTGSYAGAVTGWVNSRPQGKDALAQQQEKQVAFAQGMVQGVTLTKLEALEHQQTEHQKKWAEHVGGSKKTDQLFVEQEQQRQAQAALLAMQPQGRA